MSDSNEKEKNALEKLGRIVREAVKQQAQIRQADHDAVGAAVRQDWEKKLQAEKAQTEKQDEKQQQEADKSRQQNKSKDKDKDWGHSH
jgi:hypothetical protein